MQVIYFQQQQQHHHHRFLCLFLTISFVFFGSVLILHYPNSNIYICILCIQGPFWMKQKRYKHFENTDNVVWIVLSIGVNIHLFVFFFHPFWMKSHLTTCSPDCYENRKWPCHRSSYKVRDLKNLFLIRFHLNSMFSESLMPLLHTIWHVEFSMSLLNGTVYDNSFELFIL